jgi:hypothetical protein
MNEYLGEGNDVVTVKVGWVGSETGNKVGVPINPPPPIYSDGGARW